MPHDVAVSVSLLFSAPRQSSRPPPSLILTNPPRSFRFTPRLRLCSPLGRPSRGALPCLYCCFPGCGPVFRTLSLLSSSPLWPWSSSLSPPLRAAIMLCPHFSLPLRRFSPLLPSGPFGRLSCPARPFPRPRSPILPLGTKMLAIGRAGFFCAGQWRAGPHLAGRAQAGPSP